MKLYFTLACMTFRLLTGDATRSHNNPKWAHIMKELV